MFVDTNILVNARILEAPHHESARAGLESALRGLEPPRISRQVMREYRAVVTRPGLSGAHCGLPALRRPH